MCLVCWNIMLSQRQFELVYETNRDDGLAITRNCINTSTESTAWLSSRANHSGRRINLAAYCLTFTSSTKWFH
ncbi:hypothetical protein Mapa_012402 [Marchantia paleacea]|nr:hypothetical protein Mapa_012402 [Marchantia paleacea]